MPIFGWDTSHYDGTLTVTILARAKAEGITFWTHKLGEGLDNTDPLAAEAFVAAHAVGFPVVGGYYFLHHGQDMVAQAKRCVAVADQVAPWWRAFDGWFFQADAETESPYGLPTEAEVKLFSDTLARLSGKVVIVYASAGQYGDRLTGLSHALWNANYGTNPHGDFKSVYPGDDFRGWNDYSGQTPALLQYGSNTTIAGLTTCDANAFRGTLNDLLKLVGVTPPGDIGADVPATVDDAHTLLYAPGQIPNQDTDKDKLPAVAEATAWARVWSHVNGLTALVTSLRSDLDAQATSLAEILALLKAAPPATATGDLAVTGTLHLSTPPAGG